MCWTCGDYPAVPCRSHVLGHVLVSTSHLQLRYMCMAPVRHPSTNVWDGCALRLVVSYLSVCLQATGYGGTVSQTHNIEAKLKAREDNPNLSQDERAKQREVQGGRGDVAAVKGGGGLLHSRLWPCCKYCSAYQGLLPLC